MPKGISQWNMNLHGPNDHRSKISIIFFYERKITEPFYLFIRMSKEKKEEEDKDKYLIFEESKIAQEKESK